MTEDAIERDDSKALLGTLAACLTPLLGIVLLFLVAPEYFAERGFPLDDAWIHMVYGRNFAESFSLAYNLGEPATGATSPMWAWLLAIPHLLFSSTTAIVASSKALGFFFHCGTAGLLFRAASTRLSLRGSLAVAALVGLHPDLVAASISGMEISLSTFVAAGLLWSIVTKRVALFALFSLTAGLARPELSVFYVLVPALYFGWQDRGRALRFLAAGTGGTILAWGGVAIRNTLVSTRPLPATFYAKAEKSEGLFGRLWSGFDGLLPQLALFEWPIVLFVVTVGTAVIWIRAQTSKPEITEQGFERIFVTAWLSGIAFCATSFVLIDPVDPPAFYHQRYVLPALPFMLVGLGGACALAASRISRLRIRLSIAGGALTMALAYYAVDAVPRFLHLSNDAKNIDDVQVRVGRHLAKLSDDDVVWIVDAGASRYFGNGYFVDTLGLNSFQILYPGSEEFIEAHPPDRLELVKYFSGLVEYSGEVEEGLVVFEPTTAYTVTSAPGMAPHALMRCQPGETGVFGARKTMPFTCPSD